MVNLMNVSLFINELCNFEICQNCQISRIFPKFGTFPENGNFQFFPTLTRNLSKICSAKALEKNRHANWSLFDKSIKFCRCRLSFFDFTDGQKWPEGRFGHFRPLRNGAILPCSAINITKSGKVVRSIFIIVKI